MWMIWRGLKGIGDGEKRREGVYILGFWDFGV
jgi:hypothetical protein